MLFFCAIQTRDRLDHLQQSPSMREVGKKCSVFGKKGPSLRQFGGGLLHVSVFL